MDVRFSFWVKSQETNPCLKGTVLKNDQIGSHKSKIDSLKCWLKYKWPNLLLPDFWCEIISDFLFVFLDFNVWPFESSFWLKSKPI